MFRTLACWTIVALAGLAATSAIAQQAEDIFAPVTEPVPQVPAADSNPAGKAAKPAQLPKKATVAVQRPAKSDTPAQPTTNSDLDQRLNHIEEQLADMQVVTGTFQSMARSRLAAPAGAGTQSAADTADLDERIGRLEALVQTLGGQVAELNAQLRAMGGKQGQLAPLKPAAGLQQQGQLQPSAGSAARQNPLTSALVEQPANADTGFGQTAITPGDAAGQQDATGAAQSVVPDASAPDTQVAALPPANDPQSAYDQAYGLILQQDYAGAETAFRTYLARYPQSPLSSNAHYWLGQSYYARGQYKPAADIFLKGYRTYRAGQKAPDSLLKVAMSLSRLGQRDMACQAFTALDSEFPNASGQIKHLATTERERTGC
jgi:tol-pal system protein YbgF